MSRLPQTRDCALKGCTRAEHRGGVCREHWALIPFDVKMRAASDMLMTNHLAGQKHRRRMTALAREAVSAREGKAV